MFNPVTKSVTWLKISLPTLPQIVYITIHCCRRPLMRQSSGIKIKERMRYCLGIHDPDPQVGDPQQKLYPERYMMVNPYQPHAGGYSPLRMCGKVSLACVTISSDSRAVQVNALFRPSNLSDQSLN